MNSRIRNGLICAAIGIAIGWVFSSTNANRASAQAVPAPEAAVWEYSVHSSELSFLHHKLAELGTAGWDVCSIICTEGEVKLDATNAGKITTRQVTIAVKRLKKR